ncbi:hypothetical protein ACFWYW_58980 [Nonomuraea sp. NPDC059023]|uniref:hypothetical protein n=1 Tax=unclassified Nonomuraea TaxID=2593643 RepID=UPI0036AF2B73
MSVHSNLADTLAEPADQSVVIVGSDYDMRLWQRNDREAAKGIPFGQDAAARWFKDGDLDDEPLHWKTVLTSATHVWERGPLLASQQSGEAT